MKIACPFCSAELPAIKPRGRFVFCHRLEAPASGPAHPTGRKAGETWYEHSLDSQLISSSAAVVTWSEQISPEYLAASRARQTRFVSVVGPSCAGKSVWLLAVGSHVESSWHGMGGKGLVASADPSLQMRIFSAEAANKDFRRESIERFPLGILPTRTDLRHIPTLPMSFSFDPRKRDRLCFVLKDVAGEAADVLDFAHLFTSWETRHLFRSEWIILALDASDDSELRRSAKKVETFVTAFQNAKAVQNAEAPFWHRLWPASWSPFRRLPGVVVTLMRVDGRHVLRDDPLLKAVNQMPNRFPLGPGQLGPYLQKMADVQTEVKNLLDRTAPKLLTEVQSLFDPRRTFYSAVSSLGTQPCQVDGAGSAGPSSLYEAQCVTEPAVVRVLDPLLWILKAENRIPQ